MIPDLFLEERRQEILRRIQQRGRASVSELSQEFGVSEQTVRGDLQALAELQPDRAHARRRGAGGGRPGRAFLVLAATAAE